MLLPHANEAVIEQEKLQGYLLSHTHPVGRFKARFFNGLGFRAEEWPLLDAALRRDHLTEVAKPSGAHERGQAYTIRAILKGPTGTSASVVSVWFVRRGEVVPRFVTAYPGGGM